MSAVPITTPTRSPRPSRDQNHPHIEIVASRGQRRARPRLLAAIVMVGGLFAILAAQLLLTIATSDGAYEISSLQREQGELARDQQVLVETLQVLGAPQHLAAEAQEMGMVASSSTAYLRLADSAVLGFPVEARASSALRTAADGGPLIPNRLLTGVPLSGAAGEAALGSTEATSAEATVAEVPGAPGGAVAVLPAQPAAIPSPNTH